MGNNLDLWLASEEGGSPVGLSPEAVESAAVSRQMESDLNWIVGYLPGVEELLLKGVGNNPPPHTHTHTGINWPGPLLMFILELEKYCSMSLWIALQ